MDRVCIDASLAIAWITYDTYTEAANALAREWSDKAMELLVPPIFHAEVMSVLRQETLAKRLLPDEGEEALSICFNIPVRVVSGDDVNRNAWAIAGELGLSTTSDALYLSVAQIEGCEFWTADKRFVAEAAGKRKWVRWVGEYGPPSPHNMPEPVQERPRTKNRVDAPKLDDPGLWRRM